MTAARRPQHDAWVAGWRSSHYRLGGNQGRSECTAQSTSAKFSAFEWRPWWRSGRHWMPDPSPILRRIDPRVPAVSPISSPKQLCGGNVRNSSTCWHGITIAITLHHHYHLWLSRATSTAATAGCTHSRSLTNLFCHLTPLVMPNALTVELVSDRTRMLPGLLTQTLFHHWNARSMTSQRV